MKQEYKVSEWYAIPLKEIMEAFCGKDAIPFAHIAKDKKDGEMKVWFLKKGTVRIIKR